MADIPIHIGHLPTSHYAAIGKVAANWSAFEHLVESLLWVTADADDEPGACLTAQIPNTARRFDALIALVRLRNGSDELVKRINRFAVATHALNLKRNRVVHDAWHWDFAAQKALRLEISAQKRLVFGFTPMSEDEIGTIVDEIASHLDAFDIMADEVLSSISPWQRRPR